MTPKKKKSGSVATVGSYFAKPISKKYVCFLQTFFFVPFSIKEKSFKPLYTEHHKHKIDKEQKTHFHQKHYQYSTTTTINTRINNNQ